MKRRSCCFGVLTAVLLLAGCGPASQNELPSVSEETMPEETVQMKVEYSNLTRAEEQDTLSGIMEDAGIPEENRAIFFDHVNQFNEAVAPEKLTDGFETADPLHMKYDAYEMQDEWMAHHPEFMGYNCRITAFGLFGDLIAVEGGGLPVDTVGLMDFAALEEDPSAVPPEKQNRFAALYTPVPTEATKEIETHLGIMQKTWKERGIRFPETPAARLISVVQHDNIDGDTLMVGHTGVLFPVKEEELYFVEKLAFQEPYQWLKFKSRGELSDYLMLKYDIAYDQPTAGLFVMENDQLMEGWRPGAEVRAAE